MRKLNESGEWRKEQPNLIFHLNYSAVRFKIVFSPEGKTDFSFVFEEEKKLKEKLVEKKVKLCRTATTCPASFNFKSSLNRLNTQAYTSKWTKKRKSPNVPT